MKETKHKKYQFPIVVIEWIDAACVNPGWVHFDEMKHGLTEVISVGQLVEENDKYVTLVLSHNPQEGMVSDDISIPVNSIVNWYEVEHG